VNEMKSKGRYVDVVKLWDCIQHIPTYSTVVQSRWQKISTEYGQVLDIVTRRLNF
jgi:hypothetical protein